MAWDVVSKETNSLLASADINQLQLNFSALAAQDSGAPILAPTDLNVIGQGSFASVNVSSGMSSTQPSSFTTLDVASSFTCQTASIDTLYVSSGFFATGVSSVDDFYVSSIAVIEDLTVTGTTSLSTNAHVTGTFEATGNTILGGTLAVNAPSIGSAVMEVEDGGTGNTTLLKVTQDDANTIGIVVGNDTASATDTNGLGLSTKDSGDCLVQARGSGNDLELAGGSGNTVVQIDGTNDRVGIGTAAPSYTLHVEATSDNLVMEVEASGTDSAGINLKSNANTTQLWTTASVVNDGFGVFLNSAYRLVVDGTNGNVGVGNLGSVISGNRASQPSDYLIVGSEGAAGATRSTIRFTGSGYDSTPSARNAESNGDKLVFYNDSAAKVGMGLGSGGDMWLQANGSASSAIAFWVSASASPTKQLELDSTQAVFGSSIKLSTGDETSPDCDDGGVCINIGANNGNQLTFKMDGVAHGMTNFAETDTNCIFHEYTGDQGGLGIEPFSEGQVAFIVQGHSTTEDTTDTTGSVANIILTAFKKNGTSRQVLGTTANILAVTNGGTARMILKGNGDMHITNTTLTALDDEDDLSIVESLKNWSGGKRYKHRVTRKQEKKLKEIGVIRGELLNVQTMHALQLGAITQTWKALIKVAKKLGFSERQVKQLAMEG